MVKLSVVIITLNEERNIGRCIDSVVAIADEVLVVDSFSTDQTKAIATERGARFVENEFLGHIQQKNFALSEATYDHVLSLDADECLSEKASERIGEIKENWVHDGYSLKRLTNFCGAWIRHCGWYPDRKVRLVDRRVAEWGGTNPHDRLMLSDTASAFPLQEDILHYSFPTIASHVRTANSFSEIAAKQNVEAGKRAYFLRDVILNPLFTFLKKFIFQRGFMDGYYGFIVCAMSAYSNFLKYLKIWQLQREDPDLKNG